MSTKIVCQLDAFGYFIGTTTADESPLEPGVWLFPAGAVDVAAPEVPEGYRAKWNGAGFDLEAIPVDPAPEPPTLAERRAIRWDQVKAERKRRTEGGVFVSTHWFQTDSDSRIQFLRLDQKATNALAAGGQPTDLLTVAGQDIYWKTYDNGLVPMTVALAQGIALAVEVLDAMAFARGEQLRAQIEVSEDPESIDITAGWPSTYAVRNINTASIDMLLEIQGIGPVTAQAIVDGRPWASVQDLVSISGVSQSTVDVLAPQLCT